MATPKPEVSIVQRLAPVTADSFMEPISSDTVYKPPVPGIDFKILECPPYRFSPAVVALSVDILLPKKPHLQRCFDEQLDLGFNLSKVKTYLLDSQNYDAIQEILTDYPGLRDYDRDFVEAIPDIYWGRSESSLFGYFRDGATEKIDSESVTLINIIFMPDSDHIIKTSGIDRGSYSSIAFELFNSGFGNETYIESHYSEKQTSKAASELAKWMRCVGLFVYGYLIFRVLMESTIRHADGRLQLDELEKEIWVTSSGTMTIGRVVLKR